MIAAALSEGILKIPCLGAMLGHEVRHLDDFSEESAPDVVYGWGMKQNTRPAIDAAKRLGVPYVRLEDGFIRSYGLGVEGAPPLSVVSDSVGIYYDARRPSDLENLINSGPMLSEEMTQVARATIALMLERGISKYTYAPDVNPKAFISGHGVGRRVLVVDQTHGDVSVAGGLATEKSFELMLEAAISENPGAQVWLKVHPDVVSGKKRGYLYSLALHKGVSIYSEHCNPHSMIACFDRVYTVTSQMGFEALLAGKRVTCFGVPFYAGWGLTDDRVVCERRSSTRSLLEVFFYSYLVYPKYLDPMTGKLGSIFDVIEYLSRMRERDAKLSGRLVVLGMRRWKHSQVLPFLKTATNSVYFVADEDQACRLGLRPNDRIVSWGYQEQAEVESLVRKFSCRRLVVEDGFFRSIGLGSDFVAPLSLVVDDSDGGVYYNAKIPSGIERLLVNRAQIGRDVLERAASLRKIIVQRRLTKYNVDDCKEVSLPLAGERRKIFVPGQVETDASIAMASLHVDTNLKLLQTVRAISPDAYIVYKPHPEVVAGNRLGGVSRAELLKYCDLIEGDASCLSLIDACDEVHVMTSQVGFDALLRQKMVVCHGMPFYAGWGLTTDLAAELVNGRRGVTCTLDELVAAALILYPTYVDPVTGQVVDAERAIDLLAKQNDGALPKPKLGATTRARLLLRQFRRLFWFVRASVV